MHLLQKWHSKYLSYFKLKLDSNLDSFKHSSKRFGKTTQTDQDLMRKNKHSLDQKKKNPFGI